MAYTDLGVYQTRGLCTSRQGFELAARVPLHEFTYSDNRPWFERTAKEVAAVATLAYVLIHDTCAPGNHSKMHYTSLLLPPDTTVVRCIGDSVVRGSPVHGSVDVPCVVGIAVELGAAPPNSKGRFVKQASRARAFLKQYKPNFLLSARAVLVYLASKIGNLPQATALQGRFLLSPQPTLSLMHRVILCLPHDACGGWRLGVPEFH